MKTWLAAVLASAFIAPAWADLTDLIQRYDATSWQQSDEKAKLNELEGQLAELEAMTETSEVLMWQGRSAPLLHGKRAVPAHWD